MKLSVIMPIFNRSELFERGLRTIMNQSLPKEDWELILIDNASTEDLSKIYKPYLGQLNLRHIRYDHCLHPIWKELNPDGREVIWPHTPALATNIGIWASSSPVTCTTQCEILHSPHSFRRGLELASDQKQVFVEIHHGTPLLNEWLKANKWYDLEYDQILETAKTLGEEYHPNHMPPDFYEMYWYVEFFPTDLARAINGVDLQYQRGVYAEDDHFRARMRLAGAPEVFAGRPYLTGPVDAYSIGIHQSHIVDEKGKYKNQDRDSSLWNAWADHNRNLWRLWHEHQYVIANEGLDYSPWGEFTITEDCYYKLGESYESTSNQTN